MRILVTGVNVPPPFGGSEKRLLLHARTWIEEGNKVTLLLPFKKKTIDTMGIRFQVIAAINRGPDEQTPIIIAKEAIRSLFREPTLFLKLFALQLSYYVRGSSSLRWVIWGPIYGVRLSELIEILKPDVVNAHFAFENTSIVSELCMKRRIPIVLTSYAEMIFWKEKESDPNLATKYTPMFRNIIKKVDHVISLSKHCAKGPQKYISSDKITIVFSGIDVKEYGSYIQISKQEAKRRLGLSRAKIVLYIGQLQWRKGPQYLAAAAEEIVRRVPEAAIVFVGSDLGMRKELESVTEKIKEHIMFFGSVSEKNLPVYIRAADILVFPSLSSRECMGMSMKEAMLLETPIVAFNVGGVLEAVTNGQTGFLVAKGDKDDLSKKIIRILCNQSLAEKMGKKAKEVSLAKFDSRKTGRTELDIFVSAAEKFEKDSPNRYKARRKK